jgi:hypothetical protein
LYHEQIESANLIGWGTDAQGGRWRILDHTGWKLEIGVTLLELGLDFLSGVSKRMI